MRLPQENGGTISARNLSGVFPENYCQPQCPSCRGEVKNFNETTSCVHNSDFLINCGSCQQCIVTYIISQNFENREPPAPELPQIMSTVIDLCKGTPASTDVQALQSQASRISSLGVVLASTTGVTRATKSVATTIATALTSTSIPAHYTPPSRRWIIGPVIGSIVALALVLLMVIFIRRKLRGTKATVEVRKDISDEYSSDATESKAQLHSDSVAVKELEDTEVRQPAELPALEPVGSELNSPRDSKRDSMEKWPVPLSPLSLLFVMTEMRDERTGNSESSKHETFYHP